MEAANKAKLSGVRQTLCEELINSISHGVGSALSILGLVLLIIRAVATGSGALGIVCAAVFGASLTVLYSASTLYHAFTGERVKKVFRIFDHCSIFLLIFGTYMPSSLLFIGGAMGWVLFSVNLVCAALGIVFNAVGLEKFKKISMVLYVVMGWSAVSASGIILSKIPPLGLALLLGGGVVYTVGIVFFASKRKYMHNVWHFFVLGGSVLHYFFVYFYCY